MLTDRHRKILDAILGTIHEKYADDVAVLIVYGSAVNGTADEYSDLDMLYIPKTFKGRNLAKTFIMDGIGYDIWCGSWDTLHSMMAWEDMRVSILADSELVYAASAEDRQKYETMRDNARRRTDLPDTAHDYHPALEFIKKAKNYYGELCLGSSAAVGGVLMELVNAVCYVNRRYLKYGAKRILEEIAQFPCLPADFIENYRHAVRKQENTVEICRDMILRTEAFIHEHYRKFTGKGKLASRCTGMYEEISSHWNKIRRCCEAGDMDGALMAACSLQYDLDYAKITIGSSFDLMSGWNPRNLNAFRMHCDAVEQDFIRTLRDNGISILTLSAPDELKLILTDAHDDEP
ncbi:MAG: nucleotidyltransferase domain-containing protein [Clostridia bacterium]|nr:nucleotidyltransferase domain-containing protein [Clostridia bacterium]